MKKSKKILLALLGILVIGAIAFLILMPYRFYPGNRIKGTIKLSVDGEIVHLEKDDVRCIYCRNDERISVKNRGDDTKIGIKAGGYGNYDIDLNVPDINEKLEISVMQFNWWNVTNFDINIDIDRSSDTIRWSYSYTSLKENGAKESFNGEQSGKLEDNSSLFIGG